LYWHVLPGHSELLELILVIQGEIVYEFIDSHELLNVLPGLFLCCLLLRMVHMGLLELT
jgi:hypothetical protein